MDVPLRQHAKSTTKGESLNSKNWIGDGEIESKWEEKERKREQRAWDRRYSS